MLLAFSYPRIYSHWPLNLRHVAGLAYISLCGIRSFMKLLRCIAWICNVEHGLSALNLMASVTDSSRFKHRIIFCRMRRLSVSIRPKNHTIPHMTGGACYSLLSQFMAKIFIFLFYRFFDIPFFEPCYNKILLIL